MPLDGRLPPRCPSPLANSEGRFRFLAEERSLGAPPDWKQADASRLWRYHLHYFDWAWAFAAHPDREWASRQFRRLWRSWRSNVVLGRGDVWSPYSASLRAWSLCGIYSALIRETEDETTFVDDLALHAGYLKATLELDVGGNHLVKNLKALLSLGALLGDEGLVRQAGRLLERQLPIQVLADGGHFERSPSYHCQVLADLIDVDGLLAATDRHAIPGVERAICSMRGWLAAMLLPDGDVPLFNDCTLVGTERIALLQPAPRPVEQLTVLEPSGYVVIRPGEGTQLVADVGLPCPADLPAHAHADCLSFQLSVGGRRVLVDTGTSTYERSERRSHERSTAAHNTLEIDGENQTEVWSVFRAARPAVPRLEMAVEDGTGIRVVGSHDGYRRLRGGPLHRRSWSVWSTGATILDEVVGGGTHRVASRLHVAPGIAVAGAGGQIQAGPLTITATGGKTSVEASHLASDFGHVAPGHRVSISADSPLPVHLETSLSWAWSRSAGSLCPSGGEIDSEAVREGA